MIKWIVRLLEREVVRYLLAGAGTTLIHIAVFAVLIAWSMHYLAANTLAFAAAVVFAFYANERFVFRAGGVSAGRSARRWVQFTLLRTANYAADMGLMVLLVDVLRFDALISKIAVNVLIIVVNYVVSKFHIFRKGSEQP
jgi:putative flippase GtrA